MQATIKAHVSIYLLLRVLGGKHSKKDRVGIVACMHMDEPVLARTSM